MARRHNSRQRAHLPAADCLVLLRLEPDPESELHHPRLIRDVAGERWLPELAAASVRDIRTEIFVIEQIEDLERAVEGDVARADTLLQPRVETVDRLSDDAVARQDGGAIRRQPLLGGVVAPFIAPILAGHRREAFARSIEVDAARLDAHAEIKHTVDDGAVTLVASLTEAARDLRSRVAVIATQIGSERESDWT